MKKPLTLLAVLFTAILSSSFRTPSQGLLSNKITRKICTYEIGQHAQGGIIFFLNRNKTHGLVAATRDQMENSNYQDCFDGINDPGNHDSAGQEYTDWRLPRLWEAYKMYMNLHLVNLGGFSESSYWTSKETTGFDKIHVMNFSQGIDFTSLKSDTYRARAVRAF